MKSMRGVRRMMMRGRSIGASERGELGAEAPDPDRDLQPGDEDRRPERGEDPDAQRHGEAFDRAGAQPIEQTAGDQRRDVAVEDGAEGALEPGFERRDEG